MGYAEIAACPQCEVPVETLDEKGLRHKCNRCGVISLDHELVWLDLKTAQLNARVVEEFDRSIAIMDVAVDLINHINQVIKETTNEPITND